jgi:SAM-dependent methyltransferase
VTPDEQRRGHWPTTRHKLVRDLSRPDVLRSVDADQVAYYRARAPWYDDAYTCTGDYDRGPELNAQWLADLAVVESALSVAPLGGECVELGAGTGYWTERFIDRVDRLWALDAAPEVLAIARARLGARASKTHFEVVDLWEWEPTRVWDSAAAFFFLEHVPDEVLPGLLATLHGALKPGGSVFVAEGAPFDGASDIESRSIDGHPFEVVERRRGPNDFDAAFTAAGFSTGPVAVGRLVYFVATRGADPTPASRSLRPQGPTWGRRDNGPTGERSDDIGQDQGDRHGERDG